MVHFMESVSPHRIFRNARQQSGRAVSPVDQGFSADEIGEVGKARRKVVGDEDDLNCREFARQFVAGQPAALGR